MTAARLPTFMIVGAVKSGTTALYHYLGQHPDVFMSERKETNFFGYWQDRSDYHEPFPQSGLERITRLEQYRALFADAPAGAAVGEASPWYLFHPAAPERIAQLLPELKVVAILRDPAARAYAHFGHNVRDGKETHGIEDFERALDDEDERLAAGWHPMVYAYRRMGCYHEQIGRYLDRFGNDRVRIHLFDDFQADAGAVVRDLYRFIGVDPAFTPDLGVRYNVTGLPKSRRLHRLIRGRNPLKRLLARALPTATRRRLKDRMLQSNLERLPPLPAAAEARLRAGYRDDILALQERIGRDLSGWLP